MCSQYSPPHAVADDAAEALGEALIGWDGEALDAGRVAQRGSLALLHQHQREHHGRGAERRA